MKKSILDWPDYIVIGLVMIISSGIGIYYRFTGNKQRTVEEFFSANKSMNFVALGIALVSSFISAITILGISSEIYSYGFLFIVHYIGTCLATCVVSYFYLPVFFNLNTMSVYEYLERRFGLIARLTTSIANYVQLSLYSGIVLFAPSLALESTMGISRTTSIFLIATICTFYSTLGGIKAVLVTDVFQGMLMISSLICIMVVAASHIDGGISNIWNVAFEYRGIKSSDFRIDPTIRQTFWSLISAGFVLFCSLYGVNQVEVQRLMTVKSLTAARMALFLNTPLVMCFGIITAICGVMFVVIFKDCDPLIAGEINSYDRIMPYFVATKMTKYPGLPGLFVAGIFCASLGSISAMLNALAAVFIEDYLKRIYSALGKTFPVQKATFFGKLIVVLNCCIAVSVAFLAGNLGSLVQLTLSVTGSICGPVLGIFTLGMFFERTNEKGAVLGLLSALCIGMWGTFGQPRPKFPPPSFSADGCNFTDSSMPLLPTNETSKDPSSYFYLYRISYTWYSTIGLVVSISVGYVASIVFRKFSSDSPIEPDPNLFTPLVARRIIRRRANPAKMTNSQLFVLNETNPNLKP